MNGMDAANEVQRIISATYEVCRIPINNSMVCKNNRTIAFVLNAMIVQGRPLVK